MITNFWIILEKYMSVLYFNHFLAIRIKCYYIPEMIWLYIYKTSELQKHNRLKKYSVKNVHSKWIWTRCFIMMVRGLEFNRSAFEAHCTFSIWVWIRKIKLLQQFIIYFCKNFSVHFMILFSWQLWFLIICCKLNRMGMNKKN